MIYAILVTRLYAIIYRFNIKQILRKILDYANKIALI